ncbi:hypothetical protein EJB05_32576, partial [Eragrostis curvula]
MSAHNTSSLPGAVAPAPCCSARTLLAAAATLFAFRILLAVVLLCMCFVLLRKLWRRNARPMQPQPEPEPETKTKHGLDAAAIALLPAFPYWRAVAGAACPTPTPAECAVCLNDLDEGQTVRRLPGCKHVFHRECIDAWLASRASCPVCRGNAEPARDEEGAAACIVPIEMLDEDTASSSSTPGETERALVAQQEAVNDVLA